MSAPVLDTVPVSWIHVFQYRTPSKHVLNLAYNYGQQIRDSDTKTCVVSISVVFPHESSGEVFVKGAST